MTSHTFDTENLNNICQDRLRTNTGKVEAKKARVCVCVSVSASAGGGLSRIVGGIGSGAFEPAPRLDFQIVDCELPGPNTTHHYELPAAVTGRVLVYCYQGQGTVGGRGMTPKQTALMSAPAHGSTKTVEQAGGSDTAAAAARAAAAAAAAVGGVESVGLGAAAAVLEMVATSAEGFGVLIFAGAPIDEPISWRGPIVMGTLRICCSTATILQHSLQ